MNTTQPVLCHFITRIAFPPISCNKLLVSIGPLTRMVFKVLIAANIVYVFPKKMEAFLQLSFFLSEFSPKFPLMPIFPTCASKFFQVLSVTQFQSHFHIFRYLLQQHLTSASHHHRLPPAPPLPPTSHQLDWDFTLLFLFLQLQNNDSFSFTYEISLSFPFPV